MGWRSVVTPKEHGNGNGERDEKRDATKHGCLQVIVDN
jgi:hypothetical protein